MIQQMLERLETESPSNSQSKDKLDQLRGFVESSLLELLFRELERHQAQTLAEIPPASMHETSVKILGDIQLTRRTLLSLADDVITIIAAKE